MSRAAGRLQRGLALGAGAFALLLLMVRSYYWFWPDNPDGLANEIGLLAMASILAALALPWTSPRLGRLAGFAAVAALLYLPLSLSWFAWWPPAGLGFETHRHYVFTADFCEFQADFPAPPRRGRLSAQDLPSGFQARIGLLSALDVVTAMRADCLGARVERIESQHLRSIAEAGLTRWASAAGLAEARIREADHYLEVAGEIPGSLLKSAADGGKTLGIARVYIGSSSVLTVSLLQSEGDRLNGTSEAFLQSVRRKGSVDLDGR